jgi:hypothetical protein
LVLGVQDAAEVRKEVVTVVELVAELSIGEGDSAANVGLFKTKGADSGRIGV